MLLVSSAVALVTAGAALAEPRPIASPVLPGVPPLAGPLAAPSSPAPQGLGLLRATPEYGVVGSKFTLTGRGLPADTDVDLVWNTASVRYLLDPQVENVGWYGRQINQIAVVLAKGRTDGAGNLEVAMKVPHDYGDIHDIYAVAGGKQLAKGGFRVVRRVSIHPKSGPVGTPITIKVSGLGSSFYLGSLSVMYDNKYTGLVSAVNTRGSAVVKIRAAGPVGKHAIEVDPASAAVPYLDIEQSAVWFIGRFRDTFTVTKDAGPPATQVEWPVPVTPKVDTVTTARSTTSAGASATVSSPRGPILSKVDVRATGLAPSKPVDIGWVTVRGTRATASGWALETIPVGKAVAAPDGSLQHQLTVPDNLGGWHSIELTQGGEVRATVPYFVERSVAGISSQKVKGGEKFTIHLKGIGWTELDNGVAVLYDNGYIGYACGFFSNGDIKLELVATGGPGTHLIDLYPMTYKGKPTADTWVDQVPFLSFAQDAPGLGIGYRLPAMHLAISVTG